MSITRLTSWFQQRNIPITNDTTITIIALNQPLETLTREQASLAYRFCCKSIEAIIDYITTPTPILTQVHRSVYLFDDVPLNALYIHNGQVYIQYNTEFIDDITLELDRVIAKSCELKHLLYSNTIKYMKTFYVTLSDIDGYNKIFLPSIKTENPYNIQYITRLNHVTAQYIQTKQHHKYMNAILGCFHDYSCAVSFLQNKQALKMLKAFMSLSNLNADTMHEFNMKLKVLFQYCFFTMLTSENNGKLNFFDIGCVELFPTWPINPSQPNTNPYIAASPTTLVKSIELPNHNNQMINLGEFKSAFNKALFRNSQIDYLDYLFDAYAGLVYVTGGIMSLLCRKTNQIMTQQNLTFDQYDDLYYAATDVDIACKFDGPIEFVIGFERAIQLVIQSINEKATNTTKAHHDPLTYDASFIANHITVNRTVLVMMTKKALADNQATINQDFNGSMEDYIYFQYVTNKSRSAIPQSSLPTIHPSLLTKINSKIVLTKDVRYKVVDANRFKHVKDNAECTSITINDDIIMLQTLKFKVSIPEYITRPLEFFNNQKHHIFDMVARFHLPCVRSVYDGKTVTMIPSSIMAYMSNVNDGLIVYNAHSNNKLVEISHYLILEKYIKRGYSCNVNNIPVTPHEFKQGSDTYFSNSKEDNIMTIAKLFTGSAASQLESTPILTIESTVQDYEGYYITKHIDHTVTNIGFQIQMNE